MANQHHSRRSGGFSQKWNAPVFVLSLVLLAGLLWFLGREDNHAVYVPVDELQTAAPATETPEEAEPSPEVTPFPEPSLRPDCRVTFDGVSLKSGAFLCEGVRYVRLSEVAGALGLELEREAEEESRGRTDR